MLEKSLPTRSANFRWPGLRFSYELVISLWYQFWREKWKRTVRTVWSMRQWISTGKTAFLLKTPNTTLTMGLLLFYFFKCCWPKQLTWTQIFTKLKHIFVVLKYQTIHEHFQNPATGQIFGTKHQFHFKSSQVKFICIAHFMYKTIQSALQK